MQRFRSELNITKTSIFFHTFLNYHSRRQSEFLFTDLNANLHKLIILAITTQKMQCATTMCKQCMAIHNILVKEALQLICNRNEGNALVEPESVLVTTYKMRDDT